MSKYIELERKSITKFEPIKSKALLITNPPYGERIVTRDLFGLYEELGSLLKHKFTGNKAWVISSNRDLLYKIGLKPSQKIELLNGSLDSYYCEYEIFSGKRNDFVAKKKGYKKRA